LSKRSRESLPGLVAPVLTTSILSGIHQLNLDYVETLVADVDEHLLAASLPESVLRGLAALSPEARKAVAACPFALFSPGFEQQQFWRDDLRETNSVPVHVARQQLSRESAFTLSALFFAWHVASSQRMAAKVLFALPDAAIEMLIRMPLSALHDAACGSPALLVPRWPTNAAFWPDLVRFAALGDARRLNTTQLHGSQLNAADLRANTVSRGMLRPPLRVAARSLNLR
jgi:hypothetical protein